MMEQLLLLAAPVAAASSMEGVLAEDLAADADFLSGLLPSTNFWEAELHRGGRPMGEKDPPAAVKVTGQEECEAEVGGRAANTLGNERGIGVTLRFLCLSVGRRSRSCCFSARAKLTRA